MTGLEYYNRYVGLADAMKGKIETVAPDSSIDTRYISSEGRNDDQWISYIRDAAGVVDRWMITLSSLTGVSEGEGDSGSAPVGMFHKPGTLVVDYYADYRYGTDASNTEAEFLKKVMAFDLELEKSRRCLQTNVEILNWTLTMRLRRFETAATHWMSSNITFRFTDLPL